MMPFNDAGRMCGSVASDLFERYALLKGPMLGDLLEETLQGAAVSLALHIYIYILRNWQRISNPMDSPESSRVGTFSLDSPEM